jgi:hypothetical protein
MRSTNYYHNGTPDIKIRNSLNLFLKFRLAVHKALSHKRCELQTMHSECQSVRPAENPTLFSRATNASHLKTVRAVSILLSWGLWKFFKCWSVCTVLLLTAVCCHCSASPFYCAPARYSRIQYLNLWDTFTHKLIIYHTHSCKFIWLPF